MANHTQEFIQTIWEKGQIVPGHDKNIWRKDQCKAWIKRNEHGNRNSQFGWEIDRISAGGKYISSNCRPLQWKNNLAKSDGNLKCVTTAEVSFSGRHNNKAI